MSGFMRGLLYGSGNIFKRNSDDEVRDHVEFERLRTRLRAAEERAAQASADVAYQNAVKQGDDALIRALWDALREVAPNHPLTDVNNCDDVFERAYNKAQGLPPP